MLHSNRTLGLTSSQLFPEIGAIRSGWWNRMPEHLKARCLCKRVEFSIQPPIRTCSHCHCESCRRSHSSAFVTWSSFRKDQLSLLRGVELIRRYESSPGVFRSFCSVCGSPLLYESQSEGEIIYIPTACFESSIGEEPVRHVSVEEKVPWLFIGDGLPQYHGKDKLVSK